MISWIITACFLLVCFVLLLGHLPIISKSREGQLAKAISAAMEFRCPFLAGMTHEILEVTAKLCANLSLTTEETRITLNAARLCDLGLSSTPSEILLKKNEWTADEEAIYDRHPDAGANILRTSPALRRYATITRFHHSRFEVVPDAPISSRILCVASDYVRYKQTLGEERALVAMERQAGLHYDPEVVEALTLN
jgi:response regulator RpfG family c-di-GMP phosphodiesterase